jgi:hypothetical protein
MNTKTVVSIIPKVSINTNQKKFHSVCIEATLVDRMYMYIYPYYVYKYCLLISTCEVSEKQEAPGNQDLELECSLGLGKERREWTHCGLDPRSQPMVLVLGLFPLADDFLRNARFDLHHPGVAQESRTRYKLALYREYDRSNNEAKQCKSRNVRCFSRQNTKG